MAILNHCNSVEDVVESAVGCTVITSRVLELKEGRLDKLLGRIE